MKLQVTMSPVEFERIRVGGKLLAVRTPCCKTLAQMFLRPWGERFDWRCPHCDTTSTFVFRQRPTTKLLLVTSIAVREQVDIHHPYEDDPSGRYVRA